MSKTKTKTNKAVSKKAKKASEDAGTITIGGRVWNRATFDVNCDNSTKDGSVDGYTHGMWGIFEEASEKEFETWFHLVQLEAEETVFIFNSFDAAAVGSLIEDALDDWPTYFVDGYAGSLRDDIRFQSGLTRTQLFLCGKRISIWGLREDDASSILRKRN